MRVTTSAGETLSATKGHPFYVLRGENLSERPVGEHIHEIMLEEQARRGKLQLVGATSRYRDSWSPETQPLPGRWVDANDLKPGDVLILRDGDECEVVEVTFATTCEMVYNFHVDDFHNYCIGEYGLLVHNSCDSKQLAKDLGKKPGKGYQAAHIVPSGKFSNRSKPVRDAVKTAQRQFNTLLGKNLRNTKINGFWAKAGHAGTHTDKFLLDLGARLEKANKSNIKIIMNEIWQDIKAGEYLP